MNTFDHLHGYMAYFLASLPYILPKYILKKYGIYIGIYMVFVATQWIFNNGECLLNHKNKDPIIEKYGVAATLAFKFIFCKADITKFGDTFNNIFDFVWISSAYFLSTSNKSLQKFIIIIAFLHLYQLYKK
tara:strand:- start:1189 stop:1581 length:393 start_codon:yes stop_codon:yes gene_type:complete